MKRMMFSAMIITSAVLVSACGNNTQKASSKTGETIENAAEATAPVTVDFVKLDNYFVKNDVVLAGNINLLIAKDAAAFNKQFGAAKTMNNNVVAPDFANNVILAIVGQQSNVAATITVEQVTSDASGLTVLVAVTEGEPQTYNSTPMALISIPLQAGGTAVKVVENGSVQVTGTL